MMSNIIGILRDTYAVDKAAALNMLPELFRQYEDGLVPVLPCAIGQELYDFSEFVDKRSSPEYYKVNTDEITLSKCEQGETKYTVDCIFVSESDIGKTIFKSVAEAEQALKAGGV